MATPALTQTLTNKDISADIAVTVATTAMADCKAKGYKVSAVVVGRVGEIMVQVRGDGTGPHTMENAFKKAFTARTFRIASGDMEKRLKDNPQMGAQFLTGFTTARGGLPIKIGEDVVGAAAVSGAPGGEKDEACVQIGLDKVRDQLK
ncbi:MAG TPA: heme-binding protein [Xanthobacteraceae bacterium]|nr:heme-binding protein [Steroidobacteraceae bacterium]HZR62132.1 heme-binding protein [Xanthobacteraceae bacterium]